jgi:hypothetical protein
VHRECIESACVSKQGRARTHVVISYVRNLAWSGEDEMEKQETPPEKQEARTSAMGGNIIP